MFYIKKEKNSYTHGFINALHLSEQNRENKNKKSCHLPKNVGWNETSWAEIKPRWTDIFAISSCHKIIANTENEWKKNHLIK